MIWYDMIYRMIVIQRISHDWNVCWTTTAVSLKTSKTFCRTRSLSNATVFIFDHVTFIQLKVCSCVQNFMKIGWFLPCDAMHSAAISVTRCLSVCLSVRHVMSCAKTNKDIFEIFPPSGSQAILVFFVPNGWCYSEGNPLMGSSNARGVWKNWRFSTNISLYLRNGYS